MAPSAIVGRPRIVGAALVALTALPFVAAVNHDFQLMDDPLHVTQNQIVQAGLTWNGVVWAFTTFHNGSWHPLTWLSHMTVCEFFGTNPQWHHVVNILLHLGNTWLLFFVFVRMTGNLWPSMIVALLFGVHPLHVESVAWVAERKDVLSTFFGLLSMLAYVRYAERPVVRRYVLVAGLFVAGLMAKSMLVTLPFVFLLLDYWPLRRFVGMKTEPGSKRRPALLMLFAEKIPLFAVAAASSWVTVEALRSWGRVSSGLPLDLRLANAAVAYTTYLAKTFWPVDLIAFYPHQAAAIPAWKVLASGVGLFGATAIVLWQARRRPYIAVGWFWYVGTLIPVSGLIQAGSQSMADRFTYVPLIGVFILLGWGLHEAMTWGRAWAVVLRAAQGVCVCALMIVTWFQVGYWRDSVTLYRHALDVSWENAPVHAFMGIVLTTQGKNAEARKHFEESVRQFPYSADTFFLLALQVHDDGEAEKAIQHFSSALRLKPDHLDAAERLAWVYATSSDAGLRNADQAVALAESVCRRTGFRVPSHLDTLAAAYAEAGRFSEAVETADKALRSARSAGNTPLAQIVRRHLRQYRANRPLREK